MTAPFLPAGQAELPAERFIVFALTTHAVETFDESLKTANGNSFTARWQSQMLNRFQVPMSGRLTMVTFDYTAEANTSVTVEASADGGETWPQAKTTDVLQTAGSRTRSASVAFSISGLDLRIRFVMSTDVLVNIQSFTPRVVEEASAEYGD